MEYTLMMAKIAIAETLTNLEKDKKNKAKDVKHAVEICGLLLEKLEEMKIMGDIEREKLAQKQAEEIFKTCEIDIENISDKDVEDLIKESETPKKRTRKAK